MDQLSRILPGVLRKRGLLAHASTALVTHKAQSWLQEKLPEMATYLQVARLKDGTLTILAQHAVAAQECQVLLEPLRTYLAQECPKERIESIRIQRA